MRTFERMTRSERREIETALAGEIARIRRVPALLDFPDESSKTSERDARYQSLTKALRRFRDGTYGQCIYCGDSIPTGRLLAIPETEHCLGCGGAA